MHARPTAPASGRVAPRFALSAVVIVGAIALAALVASGGLDGLTAARSATASASPAVTATTPGSIASSTTASPAPASPDATPTSQAGESAAPSPSPSGNPGPYGGPAIIPADDLQAMLTSLQAKLAIPGVSAAILWDDGRSWVGTAGMADLSTKRPVTPDSGFALASISKTYTAAVILQLVEEGRLTLDQSVASLLPVYKLDKRITVRMLLDHTSGLPDFFLNSKIDKPLQSSPDATWTPARSWTYVAAKRPVPGTVWTYSNSNYLLLGELVPVVTGHPLATEIRTRLLEPLGLSDTWFQVSEKPRATITTGYRSVTRTSTGLHATRVGAGGDIMPFRSVITAAAGAGSIAATALDAARWMRAFAGGQVLSPAMQRAMLNDVDATVALHAAIPYGLGIERTTLLGWTALGHSGRYLGFRTLARYLPDEGVTIVVLTNQGTVDPARVATSMLSLVIPTLVLPPTPAPHPTPSGPAASAAISPVASQP